jgi:ornithine carbamoyltransferase
MQAFADLLTIWWKFGRNQKVICSFIGDGNNVAFSLFEILLLFGHEVCLIGPEKYSFSQSDRKYFMSLANKYWGKFDVYHDIDTGVKNTDIIYTDTFVSMWEEEESDKKMESFREYQVNQGVIRKTGKKTYFMHCLPAHRWAEVTDEVIDSENSLVYEQARNRMVVSRWVFCTLLSSS